MKPVTAAVRPTLASFLALAAAAAFAWTLAAPDLVEITSLDPTIHLDIRYATADNFVGHPVYALARAFLQRPAAEALARAHRSLAAQGYGLVVFDAYRPWRVTKLFWDVTPPDKRAYVADPRKGSRHNRGCAVDVTLYDLDTGKEVSMPSAYDAMTEAAHPDYTGGTAEQRAHRDILRRAMEAQGFTVYAVEWWHFDYKDWKRYPVMDVPFEALGSHDRDPGPAEERGDRAPRATPPAPAAPGPTSASP